MKVGFLKHGQSPITGVDKVQKALELLQSSKDDPGTQKYAKTETVKE